MQIREGAIQRYLSVTVSRCLMYSAVGLYCVMSTTYCLRDESGILRRKKGSFYAMLKLEIVSTGIRTPIDGLGDELSSTELFDLLMTVHKISVYQVPIFLFINLYRHSPNFKNLLIVKNFEQIL